MNKNSKRVSRSQREEAQADRVVKMVFLALLALGVLLVISFAIWG